MSPPSESAEGGFEIVEHTADVGIRAWAASAPALFESMARGLFDILGAWAPGDGDTVEIELEGRDLGALLVRWLNELIFVQESRDAIFTGVEVEDVAAGRLRARLRVAPRLQELEGTAVKAATYHQLQVKEDAERWSALVYVDV